MCMCIYMCIYVCLGICTDMCSDMCRDMCVDMCIDMCIGMCAEMCIEMLIDMCVDICIDVCLYLLQNEPSLGIIEIAGLYTYSYTCLNTCPHASLCTFPYTDAPLHTRQCICLRAHRHACAHIRLDAWPFTWLYTGPSPHTPDCMSIHISTHMATHMATLSFRARHHSVRLVRCVNPVLNAHCCASLIG